MIHKNIIYTSSSEWTFDLSKAEGSYLWDINGKKYIDFTCGWNVTNLGWNNKEIADAMIAQIKEGVNAALDLTHPAQSEYAKNLLSHLPKDLSAIGRATGGTEANEEALKTARAYTGRSKIIGYVDSYHGQSFGAMAIGWVPEYVEKIAPLVPEFIQIPFPQTYRTDKSPVQVLEEFETFLENLLKNEDIAAIVTEARILTGWGSTYITPAGYLPLVRKLTKKYGTLLILDEVGTGFSRCGRLFGMELDNVVPDIVTFAKASSNGASPIGTMVTTKEIAEKTLGDTNLTSTFGWLPISCAAANKTLQIHVRDKVWEKAESDGKYLLETLRKELKDHKYVGDIRGIGMEIGIDFVKDKKAKDKNTELLKNVQKKALENGLFLNSDNESNIQIMPSLLISRADLDKGIDILVNTINSYR